MVVVYFPVEGKRMLGNFLQTMTNSGGGSRSGGSGSGSGSGSGRQGGQGRQGIK